LPFAPGSWPPCPGSITILDTPSPSCRAIDSPPVALCAGASVAARPPWRTGEEGDSNGAPKTAGASIVSASIAAMGSGMLVAEAISAVARGAWPGSLRSQGFVIVRAGKSWDAAARAGGTGIGSTSRGGTRARTVSIIAAAVVVAGTRTQSITRRYGL
jgi:hypothetical protein